LPVEKESGDDISWVQTIQAKAAAVLLIGDAVVSLPNA